MLIWVYPWFLLENLGEKGMESDLINRIKFWK